MVTLIYRNHNSTTPLPDDFTYNCDLRKHHPITQMRLIKPALENNLDMKFYTNHHELVYYIGYLIRNKQIPSDICVLDTDGGILPFTDKGDVIYYWYSDITELSFGLLFGKSGDFSKEGLEIK